MIRKTIKVSDNNFRKFDDPLGNEMQISPERCEDFASGGVRISV